MLHRWPQGRIIRTVLMILLLLVVADLVWEGAVGHFGAMDQARALNLSLGIFYALLAAAALGAGSWLIGFHPTAVAFVIEVEQEMVRVTWPTRPEVIRKTVAISIIAFFLALVIYFSDLLVIKWVIENLLWKGG